MTTSGLEAPASRATEPRPAQAALQAAPGTVLAFGPDQLFENQRGAPAAARGSGEEVGQVRGRATEAEALQGLRQGGRRRNRCGGW